MNQAKFFISTLLMAAATAATTTARAQEAEAGAQLSLDSSGADASATTDRRPSNHSFELGIFGGVIFPSPDHALRKDGQEEFRSPSPWVGARLGYYPIRYVGIEAEGAGGLTKTDSDDSAWLWAVRGHLVGQLPLRSGLTPFVLAGAGRLGASVDSTGDDSDPALHFGLGLKYAFTNVVGVRLDLRDTLTQKYRASTGTPAHHPEILLGLAFTLGSRPRPEPQPVPADRDGDGIADTSDKCPDAAGPAPDGCPPPADTDGDTVPDDRDACPTEAGPAPSGCPDKDPDKDNVLGDDDRCPNEPGIPPDGCPDQDPDKDGVKGADDKCPDEPETKNGFEDQDGCPDTLPEKVKKFSGVIPGIEFDTGKATIRPGSRATLDEAKAVLEEYPSLRIEITGHTDTVGSREKNLELSAQRAAAVKQYLVSAGIAEDRIVTRGAGPDAPIADNATAAGRQKNRRIEFKLLSD